MPRACLVFLACALIVLHLPACTPVPQEPLRAYADTFDAAGEAGRALYGTLDTAVGKAGRQAGGAGAADCGPRKPAPACFDPADFLPAAVRPLDPDIAARVALFEAVGAYNEALVATTSGQTGEALQTRLNTLSALAGTAVQLAGAAATGPLGPLLSGPLTASFTTLARELDGARANAVARQSLIAEQDTIEQAIAALIDDAPGVYALYLSAQGNVASAVDGAPFSAESVAEFERIADFHAALGSYVVMLAEARQSHGALIAALQGEIDPLERAGVALEQAVRVRVAGAAFREAVESLRN